MSKEFTTIICRHGETDSNKSKNKIAGRDDDELNLTGLDNARDVATKIKSMAMGIIISSQTKRAFQTAKIISVITGLPLKIDGRLSEYDFGIFTGKFLDRNEMYSGINDLTERFEHKMPNGESDKEVVERIENFANDLLKNQINTVVCTHSFPAFVLKNLLNGHKVNDFVDLPFQSMKHNEIIVIKK